MLRRDNFIINMVNRSRFGIRPKPNPEEQAMQPEPNSYDKNDAGEVMQCAVVRIAGTDDTVTVRVTSGATVGDVLRAALAKLELPADTAAHLAPVVHGEDAEQSDVAPADAVVSASPRVANG